MGGQLRDVITQYKTLKQEHTEKCARLEYLEISAVEGTCNSDDDKCSSGDNKKVVIQMKAFEDELKKAKKDAKEAINDKETRENDLRIVLTHYGKLQKMCETTAKEFDDVTKQYQQEVEKVKVLEQQGYGINMGPPVDNDDDDDEEKKKKDDITVGEIVKERKDKKLSQEVNDDETEITTNEHEEIDRTRCEEIEELERRLKESKELLESSSWKDAKIATTMADLKSTKEYVEQLESERNKLQVDLCTLKSQLLLARREVNKIEERQESREVQFRTAVANHHQLQQVYASLQDKYADTNTELEKSKQTTKRAANIHGQYKKLQSDHDVVVERLERLKIEMTIFRDL